MAAADDSLWRLLGIGAELEQAHDANSEASEAIALGNILGDLRILARPLLRPFGLLRPFDRIRYYFGEAWQHRHDLAMRFYVREMFLLAEPIVHQNWHHGPREVLDTSTRANSSANIASGSSNASFSTCATGGSVVENLFSDVDDIETKMPVPEKAWLLSTIFFTTQLLIGAPSTDWKSCNRLGIILAILHTCLLAFFSVHHFTYLHCSESSKLVKALLVFGQCCSFLGACGKLTCRLGTELSSHD